MNSAYDVCLVGMCNPSANPRLVREANLFVRNGFKTAVVTPSFIPHWVQFDKKLSDNGWTHLAVDCLSGRTSAIRWFNMRARRRLFAHLAKYLPWDGVISRGYSYAAPEVFRRSAGTGARLFIAHTHGALPAAAKAARLTGAAYAFDAEDVLAESSSEPVHCIRHIENTYIPASAYISTMSAAAAGYFATKYHASEKTIVVHNTPSLAERSVLAPPPERKPSEPLTIYWFGQTLGTFSCGEQVIRALPRLRKPVRFVLRGNPVNSYVSQLRKLAASLGVESQISILSVTSPCEMVLAAGDHDIAWAAQPSGQLFHQLAIGNKVFTAMMAGLALAITDTIAHRQLVESAPGVAALIPQNDPVALAAQLNSWLDHPSLLAEAKSRSWHYAESRFNWEIESQRILSLAQAIIRS